MGEARTAHFYDFGIFGGVPEPQHQFFIFGDTSTSNKGSFGFLRARLFQNVQNR